MNNFLNFGSGMLWPFGGKVFYNHTFRGISVEQCAQRCLDEGKFRCASFDYLHDKDLNFCLLSDTSVMAGHANLSNVTLANCNHFERIGLLLVCLFWWNVYTTFVTSSYLTDRYPLRHVSSDFVCEFPGQESQGDIERISRRLRQTMHWRTRIRLQILRLPGFLDNFNLVLQRKFNLKFKLKFKREYFRPFWIKPDPNNNIKVICTSIKYNKNASGSTH